MRRFLSPVLILLLLAVLHAPTQAQALLFFDLLPLPVTTNEPVILLLTGAALLGLARLGVPRRAAPPVRTPTEASVAVEATGRAVDASAPRRRAA